METLINQFGGGGALLILVGGFALLVLGTWTLPKIQIPCGVWVAGAAVLIAFVLLGGFVFSDKDNDGQSDSMIIKPIQPVGDPVYDGAYAEINPANAKANAINAGTFTIYSVTFITVCLGVVFLLILTKRV